VQGALTGLEFLIGNAFLGVLVAIIVMAAAYAIFIPNELSRQVTTRGGEILKGFALLLFCYIAAQFVLFGLSALLSTLILRFFNRASTSSVVAEHWLHLCNLDFLFFAMVSINLSYRAISDAHKVTPFAFINWTMYISVIVALALALYYVVQAHRFDSPGRSSVASFLLSYAWEALVFGLVRAAGITVLISLIWDYG
jgi:hypothetical protein